MNYDLHIHSGLSPCAEDEMSPNNIIHMAKLHRLDLISVCDHNSTLQQELIAQIAHQHHINYWYGIEINTKEDVHLLAYFNKLENIKTLQTFIDKHLLVIKNKPEIFGHQFVYDQNDRRILEVDTLLINALDLSLKECITEVHANNGKSVLAHIYHRENGVIEQLGFIPENLYIDGVEVTQNEDIQRFKEEYPQYHSLPVFMNSDAHRLTDMIKDYHKLPCHLDWFKL